MLRPRIIPCLLVHQGGLFKTIEFSDHKYIGDPINAVKIFNEKNADELIVIDIDATVKNHEPDYKMIRNLAAECRMPLCYGGGITTTTQVKKIISLGVEKVAISAAAINNPKIINEMSDAVGSQSIVVVLDIRKKNNFLGKSYKLCSHNAKTIHEVDLIDYLREIEEAGAGEVLINSVNLDGKMTGYDLSLAKLVKDTVNIPMSFLGGAGSLQDIEDLFSCCGVVGASAGSLFIFKGSYRAVLINYPTPMQKDAICLSAY